MDMEIALAPDDVIYVDEAGQIVVERDESGPGWAEEDVTDPEPQPHIGPKMQLALQYIETHPGASRREVLRGIGSYPRPWGWSLTPIDRLIRDGLVYDLGRRNRARLYAWQNDRPASVYSHP
jgi:hypothetical protein